jgi:hypothetical protein
MTTINSFLCPVHSYPPPPQPQTSHCFKRSKATFIPKHYCKLKLSSKFPTRIFPTERKEGESFCLTNKLRRFFLYRKAKEEEFEIYVRVNITLCVKKFQDFHKWLVLMFRNWEILLRGMVSWIRGLYLFEEILPSTPPTPQLLWLFVFMSRNRLNRFLLILNKIQPIEFASLISPQPTDLKI